MKFELRKHIRDAQVNVIAQRIQSKTSEIHIFKLLCVAVTKPTHNLIRNSGFRREDGDIFS